MAYFKCEKSSIMLKKLLWNNPSPTTAFPAQTLLLDLSQYDAVIIRCSWNTNLNTDAQKPYQFFNYVPKDGNAHWIGTSVNSSGSNYMYGRYASVTDSGITFTPASYGGGTGPNASLLIPTEIYGYAYQPDIRTTDTRKFILKDGILQGTQGTDYGVLGTPIQNVGFITLDGTASYAYGIAAFVSASDKTKYKRLVFDCDGTYGAVRMYYSTTESGSRTQLNSYKFAVNTSELSNDIFLYLMPSSGGTVMNYYNIYLE